MKRKTAVVKQNLHPEYDETLLFKGRLRDFVFDELLLKVMSPPNAARAFTIPPHLPPPSTPPPLTPSLQVRDHDDFSLHGDRLGEASVSLEPLRDPKAAHKPLVFDRLPLEFTPAGAGTITFSVTWQPKEEAGGGGGGGPTPAASAATAAKGRSNSPVESATTARSALLPIKRGSSGKAAAAAPAPVESHARDHTIAEEKTMLWQ